MNLKHTPEPWDYDRGPRGFGAGSAAYSTVTAENGDIIIAEVNDLIKEGAANARLIIASPRLLKALEFITRCAAMDGPVGTTVYFISDAAMEEARAAVQEATGQPS